MAGVEKGVEITSISDIPAGTGLGSSSSFTVGLLNALYSYCGERLSAHELADKACQIEIDILGHPIGKQDQFAAAYGGVNYFAFERNGIVNREKIDITDSFLGQIERGERALSVKTLRKVVKYTGVSADYLLFGKDTNNETIQKINNILTVNSAETSDFIYHIVMYSNDFCKN